MVQPYSRETPRLPLAVLFEKPSPSGARSSGTGRVKVLAVTGSLQAKSSNKSLVELAGRVAPPGVEWVTAPSLGALPHYNTDIDGEDPPESVRQWRAALDSADAVFFASPEYGHGMPGSLKNALDWVVGTGSFFRKPVVATCAGAGPGRGAMRLATLVPT